MTTSSTPSDSRRRQSRLGILVTENRRRGAEVQAERTAEGLERLGWHVEFRSLASSPEPVVAAEPLGQKSRDGIGRFDPSLLGATRQFIRRHSCGIVVAWGSQSLRYVAAGSLGLRRRPQLGFVSIGSPLAWLPTRPRLIRYRLIASRFDFGIAVSQRTRDELTGPIGLSGLPITVIPSGVPARFLALRRPAHSGPMRVVFVGSLSEEKDPIAAVAAVGIASAESDLTLDIVGDGPLRGAVEEAVAARNLTDTVTLAGGVTDVAPYLEWADVFLLTSRTEGLPGVLLEAAAAGLPSIAFDVGAVDEIVQDGQTGILVPERSIDAAARALAAVANDADERRRLGENARAVAEDQFLIDRAVERTDRLLRSHLI